MVSPLKQSNIVFVLLCIASFSRTALAADIMLLDFTASWCQPCQEIKPLMRKLVDQGWIVRQIDADREPGHVQRWKVERLPTIIVLQDGEEVDRILGSITQEQLQQRLQNRNGPRDLAPKPTTGDSEFGGNQPQAPAPHLATLAARSDSSGPFPPLHSSNTKFEIESVPSFVTQASAVAPIARADAGSSMPPNAPSSNPMSATVRIRVDEANSLAVGTGTIIDQHDRDVLVLTCGHLFRNGGGRSPTSVEYMRNGQWVRASATVVDYQCEQIDIALLTFQADSSLDRVTLRPASESLNEGEPVVSIGCDHGADPTARKSEITKLNRYLGPPNVETSGAPVQGRSGGGLFDSQGRLIGICYAADEELDEGLYSAPAVIYEQLNKLGLSRLYQVTSSSETQYATAPVPQPIPRGDGFPDTLPARASQTTASAGFAMTQATSNDLTVIVRGPNGEQQVLEIPDAPSSLVQALQLQAMPRQSQASLASNASNLR